jgi:ATP-dependent Clp protease protease subunit
MGAAVQIPGILPPSPALRVSGNHIYFFGDVSAESISELAETLKGMETELRSASVQFDLNQEIPIHLHIDSCGGDALAGITATGLVRHCRVPVYTHVVGLAASAATLLAMSGTKRYMDRNSFMLIHQLSSVQEGTFKQLADQQANSAMLMDTATRFYLERSKLTKEHIQDLLSQDLFLDAPTCLEYGFIDEIE